MGLAPSTLAPGEANARLKSAPSRRDSVLLPSDNFAWTRLSDPGKEIRLCRIEPGSEDAPIRAALRTVNLEQAARRYFCLSYAWVTTCATENIILNNKSYAVPRNLHRQLSRVRALGLAQDLWCDSLCIAQDNSAERSIQVAMMGCIFSNADQVYLGVDEGGMLLQPSMLLEILQGWSSGSHLRELDPSGASFDIIAAQQLRRILRASFWRRVWTIQEIVLAREAFVMGEWGVIPFSTLVDASEAYEKHRRECCASFIDILPKDVQSDCYQLYNHIFSLLHTQKNLRRGHSLIQLLQLFRGLEATEDRDQLFAFWGLAHGNLPTPDYQCTTRAVFVRVASWLLENSKDLFLLSMGLGTYPQLPSWVPNWSTGSPSENVDRRRRNNDWRRRLHCLSAYDSAKGIARSVRFEQPETLCLRGMLVDNVGKVAEQILTSEDAVQHTFLIRSWRDFACSTGSGHNLTDQFAETMIEGCSHDGSSGFPAASTSDISLCKKMLDRIVIDGNFDDAADDFLSIRQAHIGAIFDRALFRTSNGMLLGLGPVAMMETDEIWILGGGKSPYVLRRNKEDSSSTSHILIGHVYVNGIMQGQHEAVGPSHLLQECRLV